MSKIVPFKEDAVCDDCGAKGAFDFMGDYFCDTCTDKAMGRTKLEGWQRDRAIREIVGAVKSAYKAHPLGTPDEISASAGKRALGALESYFNLSLRDDVEF